MASLFFTYRAYFGDVRRLALGHLISLLMRRKGHDAQFRTTLAEAIELRETVRAANAPALLAGYIASPFQPSAFALQLAPFPEPTGRALHLPQRTKSDPRSISLEYTIQTSSIQRNRAMKLRYAVEQVWATKVAAIAEPSYLECALRAETVRVHSDPREVLPFSVKNPSIWARHLTQCAKSDPRSISLGYIIQSNPDQLSISENLRRATEQIEAAKVALQHAQHDWRNEAVPALPSLHDRGWFKFFSRSHVLAGRRNVAKRNVIFGHTLRDQLDATTKLSQFFTQTGQTMPSVNVAIGHFANVADVDIQQPERAALEILSHIHKSLLDYDSTRLISALSICQKLLLAPQFSADLTTVASTWRKDRAPKAHIMTLELFLESTGWKWGCEDTSGDDDVWGLRGIVWARRSIGEARLPTMQHSSYWVVSGNLPYAWVGRLPAGDLTLVSLGPNALTTLKPTEIDRLRFPGNATRLEIGRNILLPPYSAGEDLLSQRTARLAELLTTALSEIVGPELNQDWFPTIDLVIDDLLFSATLEFWSLLHHLRLHPATSKGTFCSTPDLAAAFAAGLEVLGCDGEVQLIGPNDELDFQLRGPQFKKHLYSLLYADLSHSDDDELRQGVERAVLETDVTAGPAEAALLIGRQFDRNYETDLAALGKSIQHKSRSVVFIPTTVGGLKGHVNSLLDRDEADWYGVSFRKAAMTLWVAPPVAWAFGKKGILSSLLKQLQERDALDRLDLALLLVASKRLEKFYAEKFLRYIQVGVMVSNYVSATKPSYLVLMPGRDFIARVAAVRARRHQIKSFDVQTVFVGSRSRYKRTLADIQLTIETESQQRFQNYFNLAPTQTILSGCSKVGTVRQQGQRLNRDDVRTLTGVARRFHLVFAGSPYLDADRPILEALASSLPLWPDACLGIRLHPTSDQNYRDYCQKLKRDHNNVSVLSHLNLPQTLVSADILITRFSNVGLEAGLLDRDVIACNFTQEPAPIRLDAMGVASAATHATDLIACISDFRQHGPRWNNLQNTRQEYRHKNPQLFVDSSPDYMRDLIEKFAFL